jgi:hypothetical protein
MGKFNLFSTFPEEIVARAVYLATQSKCNTL